MEKHRRTQVDAQVLAVARRAHALALEAQMYAARADMDAPRTLDAMLLSDTGPLELVLDVRRHSAWPASRAIAVRLALGRVLAGVAPFELIGFEPLRVADPIVADPLRRSRAHAPPDAHAASRRATASRRSARSCACELLEHMARPAGVEPEEELRYLEVEMRLQDSLETQRRVADGDFERALGAAHAELVRGVDGARAARREPRGGIAAALLRAREQLDASDIAQRFYWGTR